MLFEAANLLGDGLIIYSNHTNVFKWLWRCFFEGMTNTATFTEGLVGWVDLLSCVFLSCVLCDDFSDWSLTCLAELRGTSAASGWQDGDNTLTEARAPLLDPAPEAPERCVWLAAVSVLHAVDLPANAGALYHVASCRAHGPAGLSQFTETWHDVKVHFIGLHNSLRAMIHREWLWVPEASPGSLWLDGHVAGATDARGTAGSRDGWHVADITVWGLMGNILTAPPLVLVELRETNVTGSVVGT